MQTRINHVSINARNLAESVDFYADLLGAEPIPTPNFGLPVQWLALGRTQLHLFERDLEPTSHHHLGISVDDLEAVYRVAERRQCFDYQAFGNHLVQLPGDLVQLYIRDPAGNLVELSCKAGTPVDASVFADADVEPERGMYISGRNDPRGRKRAATLAEAASINSSE